MAPRSARPLAALLLAASLLTLLPAAHAQDTATEPVPLLEDAAADVATDANGAPPQRAPSGGFVDTLDLRALTAAETPQEIQLVLQTASLDPSAMQTLFASVEYTVRFHHGAAQYLVRVYGYAPLAGGVQYQGTLEQPDPSDPEGYGAVLAEVPVTADTNAKTLTLAIARDLLADEEGAAPYPGRLLEGFAVTASFLGGGAISIDGQALVPMPGIVDRMPDDGVGLVPMGIRFGLVQSGSLRLSSDEPFRSSNGEATTFVFRVNATNLGDEQVAEFVATGAPAAWDVRTPGLVRLGAGETAEFPIIVRTAFAHAHGTATAFTVELVSQDDPGSVGRVQVGLRYPKIAQPAGHHNTVYLHSVDLTSDPLTLAFSTALKAAVGGDPGRFPYFNTAPADEDDQDSGAPVTGQDCALQVQEDNDTVYTSYCWSAGLVPGLEMGLDLDEAARGTFSIPVHSLAPAPGARMHGELLYYPPVDYDPNDPFLVFQQPVVLATLTPDARVDIGPNAGATLTGTITPTKEGDLVVYQRGAHLELRLEMREARPDNFFLGPKLEPDLMPGGQLTLPLLEYEDPIDEAFGAVGSVHLMADDPHREANPGDTVVYTVSVHNAGNASHAFEAQLIGSNLDWARIVGDPTFRLGSDGSQQVTVAVRVPDDALDADRCDLVLEVTAKDDLAARGLVRLVTTADTDAEHDDQAGLLGPQGQDGKDTPGVALASLAPLLALAALAWRRRA